MFFPSNMGIGPSGAANNISPPITSGLVLHYDFNNGSSYSGSGTTVNDLSATGADGTLTNGPVFTGGSPAYLTFDGDNDYISAGNNAALECDVNNAITIAFAMRWGGFGDSFQRIVSKETAGSGAGGYSVTTGTNAADKGLYFYSNGSSRMTTNTFLCSNISTATWSIYVIAYDGTTTGNSFININNTANNTSASATTIPGSTSADCRIGTWYNGATRELNGDIGFVSIWDRALSTSEATTVWDTYKAQYGLS